MQKLNGWIVLIIAWLAIVALSWALIPGWREMKAGLLVLAGAVALGIIAFFSGLATYFSWQARPQEREQERDIDSSPIRRITIEELQGRLGQGGKVGWVDRGATSVGDLRAHGLIAITGRMKVGKTREAIELMRRAIAEDLVAADRIFALGAVVQYLNQDQLARIISRGIDPTAPVLLFLDDLPFLFGDETLGGVTESIRALSICKAVYVIATARDDQLTSAHKAWLAGERFHLAPIPGMQTRQIERLLIRAEPAFGLRLSFGARRVLTRVNDGTPELLLMSLRRMQAQGLREVSAEQAAGTTKASLAEQWFETRRYIVQQFPAAEFILDALCIFHKYHVRPFSAIVVRYAQYLWHRSGRDPKHRGQRSALRAALGFLKSFDVVDTGQLIVASDVLLETPVQVSDQENLGVYLLAEHRLFQNRWLRRFYANAGPHAWALLDLANEAVQRKAYGEALAFLNSAIGLTTYYGFHNNRGVILCELREFDAAYRDFKAAHRLEPDDSWTNYNLGLFLAQERHQLQAGEKALRRALEINPKNAAAHLSLGNVLTLQRRYGEARQAYLAAIEQDVSFGPAYAALGSLLKKQGQHDEAEEVYRRGLRIAPKTADLYLRLGSLLGESNRVEEAISVLRIAVAEAPELAEAYSALGLALAQAGNLTEAEQILRRAIQKDPRTRLAYFTLGNVLAGQAKLSEAADAFGKAIDYDRSFEPAYAELARVHAQQGHLAKAEVLFRKSIRLDANHVASYLGLASLLDDRGRDKEAEAIYRRALAIDPRSALAQNDLGALLVRTGRLDEAIEAFLSALRINPDLAASYQNLGQAFYQKGSINEAKDAFRKAIEKDPSLPNAYYNWAVTLAQLDLYEEAEQAYSEAIARDSAKTDAYINLALLQVRQDRFDDAVQTLKAAIAQNAADQHAWDLLGTLLHQQNKLAEAEDILRRTVREFPGDNEAWHSLVSVISKQGRLDEAERLCRELIGKEPQSSEPYNNLGIVLRKQGRLRDSIEAYEAAIAREPNEPRAYANLGNVLHDSGRTQEAEAAYRTAIEKKPDLAPSHHMYGNFLMTQNRIDEAEKEFRLAIHTDPALAIAYAALAFLCAKDDRPIEAEAMYREAIARDPSDPAAHYYLGLLLARQDRLAEAEAALQQAVALDPEDVGNQTHLAVILRLKGENQRASQLLESSLRRQSTGFALRNLAGISGKLGDQERSAEYLQMARHLTSTDDWLELACLESIAGNLDSALGNLSRAISEADDLRQWARIEPDLEALHGNPRFEELVKGAPGGGLTPPP